MVKIVGRNVSEDTEAAETEVEEEAVVVPFGLRKKFSSSQPQAAQPQPPDDTEDEQPKVITVERAAIQDDAMIREYTSNPDAFYTEEYLRGLDSQKLSDILHEEDPEIVAKYYPLPKGRSLSQTQVEEISDGAELTAREPSWRERSQAAIAKGLVNAGVASDNYTAQSIAMDIVGNPNADSILESIGAADLTVPGAIFALEEAYTEIQKLNERGDAEAVEYIVPGLVASLSVLEAVPLTTGLAKVGKKVLGEAPTPPKTIDEIREEVEKGPRSQDEQTREAFFNEKNSGGVNLDLAKQKEKEVALAKRTEARAEAAKNNDIKVALINNFEEMNGLTISKGKGKNKTIDYDKVREEGKRLLDDTAMDKDYVPEIVEPNNEKLLDIMLDESKLDGMVATIAKVKDMDPDAFKGGKNVIESLFDATVKGDILADDSLNEVLERYGLNMEDYIMMTIGSGAKYGKGLQKFAQMRAAMGASKKKSAAQISEEEVEQAIDKMGKVRKNIRRGENIVRGAMVSAFATAARNFESALIRFPMEGLTNLMETSIVLASKGNLKDSIRNVVPFIRGNGYKDAFQMYGHVLGDRAVLKRTGAKGYLASRELSSKKAELVDYIMDRKEFREQYTRFYDQVNEVQKMTGRGEGGISDAVFEPIEDFVQFLNGPNRLQEFVTRRAYFLTDLDNALKREWGQGLNKLINDGQMRNMINDAPSIKPAEARPFHELLAEATDKALDKTYAATPAFPPFQAALQIINSIPLGTLILPFPRFMFKSMEYVAEATVGTGIVGARRMFNVHKNPKWRGEPRRDAEIMARNIAGVSALGAAYFMVRDPDSPVDYDKVRTFVSDKVVDVQTQYPLPQLSYIATWGHKFFEGGEGAANDWYRSQGGGKELIKLFTGTNFKDNQGLGNLLDDLADLVSDESAITSEAQLGKAAGRLLGDITGRLLQPYSMVIDAERAAGMRTRDLKDFSSDPDMTFSGSFGKAFSRPLKSRGYYHAIMNPLEDLGLVEGVKQEEEYADRQFATRDKPKERIAPALKLTAGINVMEPDTEEEKFLKQMGFAEGEFDSKTGIGTLDRAVDGTINDFLPLLTQKFMSYAERMREKGESENSIRKDVRAMMKARFRRMKQKMRKVNSLAGDDPQYVKAVYDARRIPLDTQKAAMLMFEERNGRELDLSKTEDLQELIKIAKSKKYR